MSDKTSGGASTAAEATAAPGIGLEAFGSLHAEEEPWLDRCRVPWPDFELLAGKRPYLVAGSEGSGKTALFQALRARLESPGAAGPPERLVVHWRPRPLPAGLVGKAAAEGQLATVLSSAAEAMLGYLANWTERFSSAPEDVRATLAWFICHTLGGEARSRPQPWPRRAREADDLLQSLQASIRPDEWLATAEPNEVIAEAIKALRMVGLQAVYVLVNPDDLGDAGYLTRDLEAFMSSLTLFENPNFIYKIVLPDHLIRSLKEPISIVRRRLQFAELIWEPEQLEAMVVERIRLATGCDVAELADVCEVSTLPEWLERTGASSPRGWLQIIASVVSHYLRQRRPITAQEWLKVRRQPPPALHMDAREQTITVGWRQVTVTELPLALFAYLYEHRDQLCTREELYCEAYLPGTDQSHRAKLPPEYTDDCAHLLDSAMSRLRKEIEPDPSVPLFILTEKGVGYRLSNVR